MIRKHTAIAKSPGRRGGDLFVHPASKMYVSTVHDDDQIETACRASFEAMRVIRDNGLLT